MATNNTPSGRHCPSLCYSPAQQAVLMFGGEHLCTMRNDVWQYDGQWIRLQSDMSPEGPSPRSGAGMAYDPVQERMIVAQGRIRSCANHADSPDTWAFWVTPSPSFVTFGSACAGSTGRPVLAAQAGSLPQVGRTLRISVSNLPQVATVPVGVLGFSTTANGSVLGSYALPHPLASFGMPGCTQYVSDDFTFFMLALTGQATWSIMIPPIAGLAGLSFHVQAVVPDAGANPLGAVVTNAGTGVIGG